MPEILSFGIASIKIHVPSLSLGLNLGRKLEGNIGGHGFAAKTYAHTTFLLQNVVSFLHVGHLASWAQIFTHSHDDLFEN